MIRGEFLCEIFDVGILFFPFHFSDFRWQGMVFIALYFRVFVLES